MKRLSKQKRDHLILTCVVILAVLAGLWFVVIRAQQDSLQRARNEKSTRETKETQMQDKIKASKNLDADVRQMVSKLAEQEQDMVSGDPYASLVNTVRKFKLHYKIEIPQFSPATSVSDVDLLPKFPYKQVRISISGSGYYEEVGKFIADFENEYAASRVLNLELAPSSGPDNKEKLTFKMDIVSLVASGVAAPASSK